MAYKQGKLAATASLKSYLGEEKLKELINFVLHYIADLDIPIKRGTFVEFRNGMLNISPIGRNCSQEEREEFERFDKEAKIRYAHNGLCHLKHCQGITVCNKVNQRRNYEGVVLSYWRLMTVIAEEARLC